MSKKVFIIAIAAAVLLMCFFLLMLARQNTVDNVSTEDEGEAKIELDSGEIGVLAHNNVLDFYFYYPENFMLDKNAAMISVYMPAFEVVQSDRQDLESEENLSYPINPNLSATAFSLPEGRYETVEKYWESTLNELEMVFKIELESAGDVEIDGIPAKIYTYSAELAGMTYKYSQVIFFRNRQVYTLTYTATPEKFGEYKNVLDTAVETFKFK